MLNSNFLENGLGLVPSPYFMYDFTRKNILLIDRISFCLPSLFFLSGFSFTDTDNSQDTRGREGRRVTKGGGGEVSTASFRK